MSDKAVTRAEQAKLTAAVYDEQPGYEGVSYSFWRDPKGGKLHELRHTGRGSALEVTAVDDGGHPLEG